jgi:hypothetical protein
VNLSYLWYKDSTGYCSRTFKFNNGDDAEVDAMWGVFGGVKRTLREHFDKLNVAPQRTY